MARTKNPSDAALLQLRAFGLAYPGAHTKSPWPGHVDLAVKDKTFAYLSLEGEPFRISCKLPHSNAIALALPFTEPASYGLGKSGWVTAEFARGVTPPVELFKSWIDESYRAQAPKKLVAALGAERDSAPAGKAAKKAKPATRKSAARSKTSATRRGRASRKR
jgi:predicted DNA-binding protein (MmcQ/YjbR family)